MLWVLEESDHKKEASIQLFSPSMILLNSLSTDSEAWRVTAVMLTNQFTIKLLSPLLILHHIQTAP